ncbi:Putative deoxyribose-phosphate aldolase [Zootermopsis nevadensis]|uniref:deoxyribose-phosphate aldolase n=1 Tax=Zootermopsis nevadensis TaxID=136037 RepID=A0A067RCB4_ZOONE|nr:Putative deoxyribose-phosphate aldolase [Zootermopsis nevadensis]
MKTKVSLSVSVSALLVVWTTWALQRRQVEERVRQDPVRERQFLSNSQTETGSARHRVFCGGMFVVSEAMTAVVAVFMAVPAVMVVSVFVVLVIKGRELVLVVITTTNTTTTLLNSSPPASGNDSLAHSLALHTYVGFKPAGGIRTSKDAINWLILMKEELGTAWMYPDLFRIGASGLLADIERQLYHYITGRYAALHEFSVG